jgi:hypothetical protein
MKHIFTITALGTTALETIPFAANYRWWHGLVFLVAGFVCAIAWITVKERLIERLANKVPKDLAKHCVEMLVKNEPRIRKDKDT